MAEMTPMKRQYLEIKEQKPDCILFFRLGDFYEMFDEDARIAAKELDLTLTTRDRGKEKQDQTPMCGVPYHAAEAYIARLVQRGYKVAICEQMEDPALAKGLVKRDIVRIVTPGTVVESSMLDESRNNYFACVFGENGAYGVSFCDISTGAFYLTCCDGALAVDRVISELGRFAPAEVLRGGEASHNDALTAALNERLSCCADQGAAVLFDPQTTAQTVQEQFGKSLAELGIDRQPVLWRSAGALLRTLRELRKVSLTHVRTLDYYDTGRFLELDLTARRNLELTETLRSGEKRGSLLWVLDKCCCSLGSRTLRSWLEKPLMQPKRISQRLCAVEELSKRTMEREELRQALGDVTDLERVTARIVTGAANARDLVALSGGCRPIARLRALVGGLAAPMFAVLLGEMDDLTDLCDAIDAAIVDEPPFTVREGGLIRDGYDAEIDRLRDVLSGGKGTLAAIEAQEKEKTGIKNLRVGYTRVFGYYIEVAKGQVGQVPDSYIRKQTLVSGERFITPELKELENTILTAKERITALEYEHFQALRQQLAAQADRILRTANAVGALDVLADFAHIAVKYGYCRPEVDFSGEITIRDGRHPVVEQVLKDSLFVPNDTALDTQSSRVAILTGPNMAGKSTYMRQVALIVLMAQIGCFVPAASARIGVVDRIFTRIGASDDLSTGKSTFMVEMSEVAEILTHATNRSLLILDEIGRGTSTYDGMAIARAVLEYCADARKLGAKTMFATHYHELSALEGTIPGVRNYNISAKRQNGKLLFLRKILPGAADESYGIEVAKLAGVPESVIRAADAHLRELNAQGAAVNVTAPAKPESDQVSLADVGAEAVAERLRAVDPNTLSPLEALRLLFELKNDLG